MKRHIHKLRINHLGLTRPGSCVQECVESVLSMTENYPLNQTDIVHTVLLAIGDWIQLHA